MKIETKYVRN